MRGVAGNRGVLPSLPPLQKTTLAPEAPGPSAVERSPDRGKAALFDCTADPKAVQLSHSYSRARTLPPSAIPTATGTRPAPAGGAPDPGAEPRGRRKQRAIGRID